MKKIQFQQIDPYFRNLQMKLGKLSIVAYVIKTLGKIAQVARGLATGWTARVRSRESEGWRFFFNS